MSGPLLDRFDVRVIVERPHVDELLDGAPGESTAVVAARVAAARERAVLRQGSLNCELSGSELDRVAPITPAGVAVLRQAIEDRSLSARGYHRIRRVARTLADLGSQPEAPIDDATVALALSMRRSAVSSAASWRAA